MVAVAGGGDGDWLEARLTELAGAGAGAGGVMSFGLCGALVDGLAVGDVVVGTSDDADWRDCVTATLSRASGRGMRSGAERGEGGGFSFDERAPPLPAPSALSLSRVRGRGWVGAVYADGVLATTSAAKRALHAATGAVVIDMESHIAARVAARHGLPFAIVRVVSDTAADTLPSAFAVAMRRGGGTDVAAMLRSLATRPGQIPDFARASANATRALGVLRRVGRLLGPRLGLPDLRERL